jgi:lysozyme
VPRWAWWIGGLAIISVYIAFFYYLFVSPYGFRWRALYGEVNYPEGFDIHGIDVSHYQGEIDWEVLRNQGTIDDCPIRFVMIKATEGATKVDENFEDNFFQAREYGFTRGAYHFYSTRSSAADQARFFIRNVKLENGDLPPVLDVEHKPKGQTTEAFKQSVLEWLQIVEKHYGVKPILYTYYKFKMENLNDSVFDQYPYWIAHYYVDSVEYQGQWKFWQHTDAGSLPGIKGPVDFNIYNGSYYDLRQLTIGSQETIGVDAYRDND